MFVKKKKKLRGNKLDGGSPEADRLIEGKIGSGYMSTLKGQPREDESKVEREDEETQEKF